MKHCSSTEGRHHRYRGVAGGIILIAFGTGILLMRWMDIGTYLVLLIGGGLLAGGAITGNTGLIVPGGVLSGVGLGILVNEGPWSVPAANPNGMFLLSFALGWFLITLTTGLFTARTQWWAVVPGGIMAALGAAELWREDAYLLRNCAGGIASILLILAGLYLIVRRGRVKTPD
jgi:hypothetical protein